MRTRNYNFDIDKHSLIKPVVIIRSGDHDIDTIRVTLSEQGDPVDLTKATVKFMGTTPAGNKIIDDAHIKIVDATTGIFEYTFPSAAGASVGEYQDAYFTIVMGNGQTSTMNFRIQVLSGVDISAPAASDYVSQYNTMVANLNSAYNSATATTNTKMASTVSSLATSAATVLDSALARVNTVNSTANSASSAASKAVSMASSVANTVTSQASYINSVASSAASSVSSVAASVVNKLNNLSIGGRNLMLGTGDWSGGSARWNQRGTVTSNVYRGTLIAATSSAWKSPVYLPQNAGILQVGKTYTFSTYVRNTSDTDTNVAIYYEGGIITPVGINNPLPAHTDWTRVSTTFKVIKDPTTSTYGLRWEGQHDLTNGQIQFTGYKLEEGNVATDWTPAPEDADNAYVKDTRLASGITDFNLVIGKTWSGKWYKAGAHWSNEPVGASNYLQFEYTLADNDKSGILEINDWTTNRHWVRTVSAGTWSNWIELANDANVVHNTGTETIGGIKTFLSTINGNTATATRWLTARTLALTGDVTGSVSIDGSNNVSIATTGNNLVHNTGNETIAGDKTFTGTVKVPGTLDANQRVYTRTIGSTNDLQIKYTRTGNVVTGRYKASFGGTFPLGGNDGYRSPSDYPVNIIAGGGVDAWFTPGNTFVTKGANEGNFMFITSDPLPSN